MVVYMSFDTQHATAGQKQTIKQNKNEPTNPSQSAHSPPLPSLKKEKKKKHQGTCSIDYCRTMWFQLALNDLLNRMLIDVQKTSSATLQF